MSFTTLKEIEEKANCCFDDEWSIMHPDTILNIFNNEPPEQDNYELSDTLKIIDNDTGYVYNIYGVYYMYKNEYENSIKYYKIAFEKTKKYETNNIQILFNLVSCYRKYKKIDEAKYTLLIGIHLWGDLRLITLLAYLYYEDKNYPYFIKYIKMAINLNCGSSMNNLAVYYYTHYDYQKSIELYKKSLDLNNSSASYNLALYYMDIEYNDQEFLKYIIISAKLNNKHAIKKLSELYEPLELYILFIENDINVSDDILNEKSVKTYIHKLEKQINGDCCVCLENDAKCLSFACNHFVCKSCYIQIIKINTCPLCRASL